MKFQLETSDNNLISHYGPGVLAVNGREYTSNLLITQTAVLENWCESDVSTLTESHFEPLISLPDDTRPEIVLLGSGEQHIFPDMQLLVALKRQGLTVEVMNTRAACRTYSVLVSEYRSVAAALIQIPAKI
jgi:uncharacterized protein